MSYQVLYRAWRPGTFSEICGQDAVIRTLRRQVVTQRIAHAYLFCGTRGTGKTTASKVLARAINCLNPQDGDPCGECEICQALKAENCMDVVEIDAASNNSVDEIRTLREQIQFPPSLCRYKVYIIDEVHMLSAGAFNALLKTLEEPPKHAVFILATTEPHKLLPTILSRVQRFDFHRISVDVIVGRLKVVLKGIGREAEEDALIEIARAAEGAMRDALSLLDCCLSYTDSIVTLQLTRDVLGTAGRAVMFEYIDHIIAYDSAAALQLVENVINNGSDPQVFMQDAVAHLRSLIIAGTLPDVSSVLEVTPEDAARFALQAEQIAAAREDRVARLLDLYMRIEPTMRASTSPRTLLELATVRACHPEQEKDRAKAPLLTERLDRMEKMLESGAFAARKPASKAASAPAEPPKAEKRAAPAEPVSAETPPEAYLEGISLFAAQVASVKRFMDSAHFNGMEGNTVHIRFDRNAAMAMSMISRKTAELEQALSQAFGDEIKVIIENTNDAAKAKPGLNATVRKTISDSYDLFGRENVELVD